MQSSDGQHPRTPTPTDDEILESRVNRVLAASGYAVLRQIRVSSRGGCVHLEGCVPSYYLKQLAQVMARRAEGVNWICNDLVVPEGSWGQSAYAR